MTHKDIVEAFANAKQFTPKDVTICFEWLNEEYLTATTVLPVDMLRHDWYEDCDHCPENGTFLTTLTIATPSSLSSFSADELNCFDFETLMRLIEKTWFYG